MNDHDDKSQTAATDEFLERAASVFDESVRDLDAQTRSRLNQGRQQAVAESGHRNVLASSWLPAGGAAAVTLAAIIVWNGMDRPDASGGADFIAAETVTDFEILMDEEDLEMLENLEFYSWIDLAEDANDAGEHVG